MAIITVSYQLGSDGEQVARELAHRLGFTLVTGTQVDEIIRCKYNLNLSLSGDIDQSPRGAPSCKVFANLITAILTDMALLHDLVVVECGSQFVFRSFPNAMHLRIVAPRDVRAHTVMKEAGKDFEAALRDLEHHERNHKRFLRSSFRRASDTPERYDLILNTGSLDRHHVVDLILQAVHLKQLREFGLVSNESIERAKLRNQIRLARALSRLTSATDENGISFAHPSERVFARLLDFYGIRWEYEPRTFTLKVDDDGNILEAFTPDFYLPDSNLYVELTTMKQSLVTRKNRKLRLLQELYPDVRIRLLYQKDFEDLIFKYSGKGPVEA